MDKTSKVLLVLGLVGIFISIILQQLYFIGLIACLPFVLLLLIQFIRTPTVGLYLIFTLNYFIMPFFRYTTGSGLSVLMDITFGVTFVMICISHVYKQDIPWKNIKNGMFFATLIWLLYCLLEIINPLGVFSAWLSTRMLIIHTFICVFLTSLLCKKVEFIKTLIFLLSVFTILAIIKVLIQKHLGFDAYEMRWLNEGGARTHIIRSGIRYFSFFTDASNFGSNMAFSGTLFLILAVHSSKLAVRFYFFIVGVASIYAMFLSGTRGAMIIPLAALALYCVTSKNVKILFTTGSLLILVYVFFAFTTIGEGNSQIRRMRTAFHPTKDASFMVRQVNRAKLAIYMQNKPFGAGLGMAGGNAQKYSNVFTAQIPTDSWFVMIWVQTGVVGLALYVLILLYGVVYGCYVVMYKIHDRELKTTLTAIICSTFGFIGSAYSTDSFGQFPCHIITFMFLTICILGESFQKEIDLKMSNKLNCNYEL